MTHQRQQDMTRDKTRNAAKALLLGATAVLALAPLSAAAQSEEAQSEEARSGKTDLAETVSVDIPAQDLAAALTAFARQTGVSVLFDPELVAERASGAVEGTYTPLRALRTLLAPSGLDYEISDDGAILVGEGARRRPARGASGSPSRDQIVVTAQRREENLQNVSLSVDVVDGRKIDDLRLERLAELSAFSPNLNVTETNAANRVFIRGIGSGSNPGFEQSVSTFYDGVYFGRGQQSRIPFLDIERIEVARGPQSTQFGKNAVAGALNVTTRNPGDEPEFGANLSYIPEFEDFSVSAFASGPISERFGARLAVQYRETDGFLTNTVLNEPQEQREEFLARLTLGGDLSDTVDWTLKLAGGEFDNTGNTSQIFAIDESVLLPAIGADTAALLFPDRTLDTRTSVANSVALADLIGDGPAQSPFPRRIGGRNDTYFGANTINAELGGGVLTSITGFSAYRYDAVNDLDFTPLPLISREPSEDYTQYSQELRYRNQTGALDYTVGLYFQYADLDFSRPTDLDLTGVGLPLALSSVNTFSQQTATYSAFAEGVWSLSDRLRLLGAVRVTQEDKDADKALFIAAFGEREPTDSPALIGAAAGALDLFVHDFSASRSETAVEPALTIEFDSGDDLFFARIARGQKTGGFDGEDGLSVGDTPSLSFEFEEETALAFEVGAKFVIGRANINITGFRTNYDDLQVTNFNGVAFVIQNAAEAVTQGVEMEAYWNITDELFLRGALGYLDFEFDSYENGPCTAAQEEAAPGGETCVQDLSGRTGVLAPEWTGAIGLAYQRPIFSGRAELEASVDVNFSSDYFLEFDLDPNLRQEAFAKLDARLGVNVAEGRAGLAVFGRNLTDEITTQFGNDVPLFPGAFRSTTDQPRSIGLQATFRY